MCRLFKSKASAIRNRNNRKKKSDHKAEETVHVHQKWKSVGNLAAHAGFLTRYVKVFAPGKVLRVAVAQRRKVLAERLVYVLERNHMLDHSHEFKLVMFDNFLTV